MKILNNKKVAINRLYDSDDYTGQFTQKDIQLADGKIISFAPNDSDFKSLKTLLNKLESSDKERIIREGSFSNRPPEYYRALMDKNEFDNLELDYYGTETLMGLIYSIIDNHLVVITMGEKQPGRWIVVVEGVWEVSN